MGNKKIQFLRAVMLLTDFIAINCSAGISILLWRNKPFIFSFLIINASWLILAYFFKLYAYTSITTVENAYRRSWRVLISQTILLYLIFFIFSKSHIPHRLIITYAAIAGISVLINRFLQTYLVEFFFKKINIKKVTRKIAIIGYDDTAQQLAEYFQSNKNIYQFSAFFSDVHNIKSSAENPLYPLDQCLSYAVENNVKEIYSTVLPDEHPQMPELVKNAESNFVRLRFVGGRLINPNPGYDWIEIDRLNQMPIMALRAEPLNKLFNRAEKRAFDIFVSLIAIIFIMSWLTPLLAIIIKLTSKGPVFFVQDRSGRDNESFKCMKFRSMTVNNESDERQAVKNDNRITRIGAFIRKTSLDEFPQFFNVLIGNMTICGPRPHMLKHTEEYGKIIEEYMVRHFLKPGVTGWAQVNGCRGETETHYEMKKRVEHDIWYMENWSFMLDIKIIFLTVINIFKGEEKAC